MKGIRRSLNKDKIGAPTPTYSTVSTAAYPSIATKQALPRPSTSTRPTAAPAPPKRVIRAISAYRATDPRQLSFELGDFFHVVSDDGGNDWFDAANPMTGARGMVPASCFQVLGRNVRETAQGIARQGSPGAPSGPVPASYQQQQQQQQSATLAERGQQGYVPAAAPMQSTFTSPPTSPPLGNALSSTSSVSNTSNGSHSRPPTAPKPQPLYGIVQYDFVAERTDELDAKRGEPIIVIAQSNHEWFVAKPIGRLGGPGLIPVAFVEIQDMTTGKPVENVEELIRSAVVPKVEEWKKMTADYKNASIPLGRFDFAEGSAPKGSPAASYSNASTLAPNTNAPAGRHPSPIGYSSAPTNSPLVPSPAASSTSANADTYDENLRYSYSAESERYGLITQASVESFHQEEGSFWFHLRAHFSTGASLVLYRLYSDFYEFQISLMDEFPVEAGRVPPGGEGSGRPVERILPMMPGPTEFEDEVVCAQRVHDLSIYLADLCTLPERLRSSAIMYDFFVPRAGDVEVEHGHGTNGRMPSIDGQYGELVQYLDQMDGPGDALGMGRLSLNGDGREGDNATYRPSAQQQRWSGQGSYADGPSSGPQSNDGRYQAQPGQSYQATYGSEPAPAAVPPVGSANQNVPFVKIKIFHRNTDDLIAIRVPPTVSHASLLEKVRERLGGDVVNLRYREEVVSGSGPAGGGGGGQVVMAGGARLIGIDSDEELDRWIHGGSRLVLYAD